MRYLKLTLGIMVTTAMVTATQAANVIEHRYKEDIKRSSTIISSSACRANSASLPSLNILTTGVNNSRLNICTPPSLTLAFRGRIRTLFRDHRLELFIPDLPDPAAAK